jgi:hypothetical protein
MSQQPIKAWLTDTKTLKTIINRAHYLNELTQKVRHYLAEELAAHCQVANYQAGKLVLIVDSSVWASRLRFSIPQLCKSLQTLALFEQLKTIEYTIKSLYEPIAKPAQKKLNLSMANSTLLTTTAEGISDTKLQQALLRLAQNFHQAS